MSNSWQDEFFPYSPLLIFIPPQRRIELWEVSPFKEWVAKCNGQTLLQILASHLQYGPRILNLAINFPRIMQILPEY
jgi:hypothetical protein